MKGATKYINSLLRFPNKTVNFLSKLLYYSTTISSISTKIENKISPQKLAKHKYNKQNRNIQTKTEILFGNICCPFHNSPLNVKISFPFCVFGVHPIHIKFEFTAVLSNLLN